MSEAYSLHLFIAFLHPVEEFSLKFREPTRLFRLARLDETDFKGRNDHHCINQGCTQCYRYDPRESGHEITQISRNDSLYREKHHAYGKCGGKHRQEQFLGTRSSRIHLRYSPSDFVHIAVHGNDGVVHYHSQYDNQGG